MTPDGDLPVEAGPAPETVQPASQEDILSDISDLLDAPETPDLQEPDEEKPAAEEPFDPLGDDAEDVENVDDADADKGPDEPEFKGGRFAADDAKVRMEDGTTITIAELKRNNLYQRGFTEKTTALAEERKQFEAKQSEVTQYAQSLNQSREQLATLAQHLMPKQPEPFKGDADSDPVGYLRHTQEVQRWNEVNRSLQAVIQQKQSEEQKKSTETAEQERARLAEEDNKLVAALSFLKDPEKFKLFQTTMEAGAAKHYGLTPQQLWGVGNHKAILVMRDALAYRRLKEAAPQVKETAAKRPAATRDSRRADPRGRDTRVRQEKSERLSATGSLDDFVGAAQHLIDL